MSSRSVLASAVLPFTLTGAHVLGRATVTYPDVMGVRAGVQVAAAGLPLPFIAHYPGLSPASSADLVGAALGLDRVLRGRAIAVLAFWSAMRHGRGRLRTPS